MKTAKEYALDYANDASDMYSHEVLAKHFQIALNDALESAAEIFQEQIATLVREKLTIWNAALEAIREEYGAAGDCDHGCGEMFIEEVERLKLKGEP